VLLSTVVTKANINEIDEKSVYILHRIMVDGILSICSNLPTIFKSQFEMTKVYIKYRTILGA
jgi:hypothetical protein